jgi:hypothetical protein
VDNLRLFKGVILGDAEGVMVDILAGKAVRNGSGLLVPVELRGRLANGREVIHARAEALLTERQPARGHRRNVPVLQRYSLERAGIYQQVLFHGPALQGIARVEGFGDRAIVGWVSAAPPPSVWLERPLRSHWLTDPLAIDSAFQLVVLWSREQLGANSLPGALGRYRQFQRGFPESGVRVLAEIQEASRTRVLADIEFLDSQGDVVARLDSYECVVDPSLNQAFRRNELVPPSSSSRAD